jgi:hypothetical protein
MLFVLVSWWSSCPLPWPLTPAKPGYSLNPSFPLCTRRLWVYTYKHRIQRSRAASDHDYPDCRALHSTKRISCIGLQNSTESLSAVLPDAVFPYELLQPMPVAKLNGALELAIGVHPSHPLVDVRRRSVLFKGKLRDHDSAPVSLLGSSRTVHHLGPSGQSLTGFVSWLGRRAWRLELG